MDKTTKSKGRTSGASTNQEPDDFFGGCPHCGGNDGYLDYYRAHWFLCKEHRVCWLRGENLFSSWRHLTEEDFEANRQILEEYVVVEPIFSSDECSTKP